MTMQDIAEIEKLIERVNNNPVGPHEPIRTRMVPHKTAPLSLVDPGPDDRLYLVAPPEDDRLY